MSSENTIDGPATPVGQAEVPSEAGTGGSKPVARRRSRRGLVVGAIAAPLAMGAVGLSLAQSGSTTNITPVAPTTIASLAPSGSVAARGEVAELFGNTFVLQDGTGRALVETGPRGEGGTLVSKGETVTAQGRFDKGFLHAMVLTRADGTRVLLGPAGGPPPGTMDWVKDKVGLGPKPDVPALITSVEKAGYTAVRVAGRGPRHLDVAAKGQDGKERLLHVGFDGQIHEKQIF